MSKKPVTEKVSEKLESDLTGNYNPEASVCTCTFTPRRGCGLRRHRVGALFPFLPLSLLCILLSCPPLSFLHLFSRPPPLPSSLPPYVTLALSHPLPVFFLLCFISLLLSSPLSSFPFSPSLLFVTEFSCMVTTEPNLLIIPRLIPN